MESTESKEIIVRKAVWEDQEVISAILATAFDVKAGSNRRWWNIISDSSAFPYVVEVDNVVMGTATLYVLEKLIHSGGKVGLIEDVAVSEEARGLGLGKLLIETLTEHADKQRCYKVVLSCSENNVPFYEKCDFYRHEVTMRKDLSNK
jgi:glucosamine-phosphate N-acetyltransferase